MSLYPLIRVALDSPGTGVVLAVGPAGGEEHLPPSRRGHLGTTVVVGSFRSGQHNDGPVTWTCWLWPAAGGNLRTGQSCETVQAASPEALGKLLQDRVDAKGAWWA